MTDTQTAKDLAALLKGGAVGVRGDGTLLSALSAADCGITFKELSADCAAAIFDGSQACVKMSASG